MLRLSTTHRVLASTLAAGLLLAGCADDGVDEEALEQADDIIVADEDDHVIEVQRADGLAVVQGDEESLAAVAAAVEDSVVFTSSLARFGGVSTTPLGENELSGEGVSTVGATSITLTMRGKLAEAFDTDEVEVEVRVLDNVMYQRFPVLLAEFDTDAEWVAFDLDAVGSDDTRFIARFQQGDHAQAFAALRELVAAAEIGTETINDIKTTHYVGTMNLRAAVESGGIDPTLFQEAGLDLDQDAPVDIWIDGDGLLRRYETTVSVDGASVTTWFEVLDYGVSTEVVAPPADSTVAIEELTGERGNG